jgi:subtilisin family serine protease
MASPQEIKVMSAGREKSRRAYVPGHLIVRFKASAVRHVASTSLPRAATARVAAQVMPDEVVGPLDLLKDEAGLLSMKPLFVASAREQPSQRGIMALAGAHRALAISSTAAPRESLSGFQLVRVRSKEVGRAFLKRLQRSRAIDFVEPVPNRWLSRADPMINRQWGLRAINWFNGPHPDAQDIHVAVLDSGIDSGHPDLAGSVEEYRHDGNSARDFLGHGTHVSGTIAAVVNNSIGIAGVANCRLHCWKIFDDPVHPDDDENFNFDFYSMALASALDANIKVINLSIGGTDRSRAEAAVFRELVDDGVVISTAMGNEYRSGNPTEYPAGYPDTLGVGAIDEADRRAPFSNTGRHIRLVAPGVNVLSTVPRVKASLADHTDYDSWPGTSMATPHVTGAAALVYVHAVKSKAAAAAVRERLTSTAKKLPGMRGKDFTKEYGFGLLDLAAALNAGGGVATSPGGTAKKSGKAKKKGRKKRARRS